MKPWIARDRFYNPWVCICNIQLQIGHKKSPKAKIDFSGGSDSSEPACDVGDLGWIPGSEDLLEKGMTTDSSILYSPQGHKNLDMTEQLTLWAFLVTQMIKNLPAVKETQVLSLGQKDPLEKGMAIHSRSLVWRIPWTEEPGGLKSMGSQRARHDWATDTSTKCQDAQWTKRLGWCVGERVK